MGVRSHKSEEVLTDGAESVASRFAALKKAGWCLTTGDFASWWHVGEFRSWQVNRRARLKHVSVQKLEIVATSRRYR